MKHTTWKKLLSLLLVVAMVSSFGVTASATETEGSEPSAEDVTVWRGVGLAVSVDYEYKDQKLPAKEHEKVSLLATPDYTNAPEEVKVTDGKKEVIYTRGEATYSWKLNNKDNSSITNNIEVTADKDTTVKVTATVTYKAKNKDTRTFTDTAEIKIPNWGDVTAPTVTVKSSASKVDIGNSVTVTADVKGRPETNYALTSEYTWSIVETINSKDTTRTETTKVPTLTLTPDVTTKVTVQVKDTYSDGSNKIEKTSGWSSSTTITPDWTKVVPEVTLTSNKEIVVNADKSKTIAATTGENVAINASVQANAPKGWKVSEIKYGWYTEEYGNAASRTVEVKDKAQNVTLTKVKVFYVNEKNDQIIELREKQLNENGTITINPGYTVSKFADGANYTLELTATESGKADQKLSTVPVMVGSNKGIKAEIVPATGYVKTASADSKIYYEVTTTSGSTTTTTNTFAKSIDKLTSNVKFGVAKDTEIVRAKQANLSFDLNSGLEAVKAQGYTLGTMEIKTSAVNSIEVTYGETSGISYPEATIPVTKNSTKKTYEVTGWKYTYSASGKTVEMSTLDAVIDAAVSSTSGANITAVAQWGEKSADITVTLPSSGTGYKVTRTSGTSTTKYEEGDTVTFTVEAEAGYKLADLIPTVTKGSIVRNSYTKEKATFTYTVGDDDGTISYGSSAVVNAIKLTITLAPNLNNNGALSANGTAVWKSGSSTTTLNTGAQTWTYASSGTTTITAPSSGTLTGLSTVAADSSKSYDAQGWTVSGTGITTGTKLSSVSVSAANLRSIVTSNNLHEDTAITLTANWDQTINLSAAMDFNFTALAMTDNVKASADDTSYGYSLWSQLLNALNLNSSTAGSYYIKFTSLGSSLAGTLYEGSGRSNTYLVKTSTSYYLSSSYNSTGSRFYSLEFEPNTRYEGYTYSASFDVYDGTSKVDSGTMNITTGIAGDVVIYLDDEDSVQFDEGDFEDWYEDAASESRPTLTYISFDKPDWDFDKSNGYISYDGTDSDDYLTERELSKDDYYVEDEANSSDKLIEKLYYVAGSKMEEYYVIDFTGYGSGRNNKADGKLVIVTGGEDDEESVDHDLVYNVKYNSTLTLSSDDIESWAGSKFDHLVFDSVPTTSQGTLTYKKTSSKSASVEKDEEYDSDDIDTMVFTPKGTSYTTVTLKVTAYNNKDVELKSGAITICVVKADVPQVEIEVDPGKSVNFTAAAFNTAASAAVGSNVVNSIQLLGLPSEGDLYVGSTGKTKASTSTKYLMSSTSKNVSLISDLRYVADNKKGSITVDYIAYNKSGNTILYTGEILITIGDTGVSSGSIYAVGSLLPVSSIKSQAEDLLDKDFSYITIKQSDNAIIYYNYNSINSHGGAASESTKYYYQATSSQQSMSRLTVVPYADRSSGEKIEIEINCYDEKDNVTKLTVSYSYVKATTTGFNDTIDDWYKDSIYFLSSNGVAQGNGYAYGVGQNITRGDFMLMLYRAFNLESISGSNGRSFADVSSNDYYYDAVVKAAKLGIANGQQGDDGQYYFNPTSPITREEAFTLIYRTMTNASVKAKLSNSLPSGSSSTLYKFSDYNSIQSYAQTALKSLVQAGLVTGSDGQIKPGNYISREEMAVVLHRALTRY